MKSDGVPDSRHQVRTADGLKYVDFAPYEEIQEAYNATADPWETRNLIKDPAAQGWIAQLRSRLAVLRNCTGAACWE